MGRLAADSALDEALTISRPSTIKPVTGGRRLLTPITSMEEDENGDETAEVAILKPRMTLSPATEDEFASAPSATEDVDQETQITASLKRVSILRPTISPTEISSGEEE
jgi:hypothetical protein